MYQPSLFREERLAVMHDLMRAHPLATLVTADGDGLTANHIPLMLHADLSERGTLRGHVARANELSRGAQADREALAIFQGPQHYVTPAWYPSKTAHGKVVPTWNYAVVHAHGRMRLIQDADWLGEHVQELTATHEAARAGAWAVTDAPDAFIARQLRAIVGFEMEISRLEGKWKMSQNRSPEDRAGVIDGLRGEGSAAARRVADLISE